MKRPQRGSTIKQYAYATRRLSGQGTSKKEIALLSGYSMTMAENAKAKIEDTDGYQNAIGALAADSNNLLVAVMAEFKVRGLSEFSNGELIKALNAVGSAWDRIEKRRAPNALKTPEGNRLRGVFTERVRTARFEEVPTEASASANQATPIDATVVEKTPDPAMDF